MKKIEKEASHIEHKYSIMPSIVITTVDSILHILLHIQPPQYVLKSTLTYSDVQPRLRHKAIISLAFLSIINNHYYNNY